MKIVRSKEFRADRPWGALDIATMNGITTRLHWTDQPYRWHVNEGEEVFAVLDGKLEMRYRQVGHPSSRTMLSTHPRSLWTAPASALTTPRSRSSCLWWLTWLCRSMTRALRYRRSR